MNEHTRGGVEGYKELALILSKANQLSFSSTWVQPSTLQIRLRRVWPLRSSSPKTTLTPTVCNSHITSREALSSDQAFLIVVPAHIAFVLLNEGAGDQQPPGGVSQSNQGSKNTLFTSVIQKVGGDPVSLSVRVSAPHFVPNAVLRLQ